MTRVQEAREHAARARRKAAAAANPDSKNTYLLIAASFDKVADDQEYIDRLRAQKRASLQ
jgi:hypothetical protein